MFEMHVRVWVSIPDKIFVLLSRLCDDKMQLTGVPVPSLKQLFQVWSFGV